MGSSSNIAFRNKTGFAAWWLFWFLLTACIVHRFGFNWRISFMDAAITNLMLTITTSASSNALRYYQPGGRNYVFHLGWIIALSVLVVVGIKYALLEIFKSEGNYLLFLEHSLPTRLAYALLMNAFASLACWISYLLSEQKKHDARKLDAEKLLREAELSNLRQQLQPHFLFNSLNSISALAGSKPNEARRMIQQLSDFLRGTLKKDEQQLVKLSEELEHLKLYLDIEKVRFGHRLNTEVIFDGKCADMLLPSLLLQPIVENAIKFGLYDTTEAITISIEATCTQNLLNVSVTNPYDPTTARAQKGTGFGLNAVQRRLYLLYARQDLLQAQQDNNNFKTLLTIPQL